MLKPKCFIVLRSWILDGSDLLFCHFRSVFVYSTLLAFFILVLIVLNLSCIDVRLICNWHFIRFFTFEHFVSLFTLFFIKPCPLDRTSKMSVCALAHERFWDNKAECDDAERKYYLKLSGAKVHQIP